MGDETIQIASRFSNAVDLLASLGEDDRLAALARRHGARLPAVIGEALSAVEAVYGAGTDGVRNWPEKARLVLARVAEVRDGLARSGVDAQVRRLSRALAEAIDPASVGG